MFIELASAHSSSPMIHIYRHILLALLRTAHGKNASTSSAKKQGTKDYKNPKMKTSKIKNLFLITERTQSTVWQTY